MRRLAQLVALALRDLAGIAGAAAVVYGAWQIHGPSGWIVGGGFALAGALLAARRGAAPRPDGEA